MKLNPGNIRIILFFAFSILVLNACHQWDNFTTYFNTYYNAQRIMDECEDEFDFLDEKKRTRPNVYIPAPEFTYENRSSGGPPPFMEEFLIGPQKLQPVAIKLDSILIKGSKILAHHPNSDYVEGALYLMAKTYFYRGEWLPAQVKCSELIDKFPSGDFSPDAHLLQAKTYLIQQKLEPGKVLLSRCVDMAWQKERYDILSEAFRLEAELALYQGDKEGALKPYRQAIAQVDDSELRAKWQVDLAALLFRLHEFEIAEKQFANVSNYSPDYQAEFEADLYRASCLNRLGRYDEANEILEDLEGDGKWDEWKPWYFAERMNQMRLVDSLQQYAESEKFADSAWPGNPAITGQYFEMGMDYFDEYEYRTARTYFARARQTRTSVHKIAERLYALLNMWESNRNKALPIYQKYANGDSLSNKKQSELALSLFELGRIHYQLRNFDSAKVFYRLASEISPKNDTNSARYLYVWSRSLEDDDPLKSDSIMIRVVEDYPLTVYGEDARKRLGYTEAFIIDTVAELYYSGDRLRKYKEYHLAIGQFKKIYDEYPGSDFTPKALYSIGWIYEKNLYDVDSALYYYQLLIEKFSASEYAQDVRLSVDYLLALRSGKPLPDSLKQKKMTSYKAKSLEEINKTRTVKPTDIKTQEATQGGKLTPESLMNDPTSIFNNAKKAIQDPSKLLQKDLKLPEVPKLENLNPLEKSEKEKEEKEIEIKESKKTDKNKKNEEKKESENQNKSENEKENSENEK